MDEYFPLFLKVRGRTALVVGGGPVGRRKASALVEAGAGVRIVCLESPPKGLDATIEWRQEAYRGEHLEGVALAFAAGPPDVNQTVVADARARGVWVNSATVPAGGDFVLPAVARRGRWRVAVGTEGASPMLARAMRDRLARQVDEADVAWAELLAELRPLVLDRVSASRRGDLFASLTAPEWPERIRIEGVESAREAMCRMVDRAAGL